MADLKAQIVANKKGKGNGDKTLTVKLSLKTSVSMVSSSMAAQTLNTATPKTSTVNSWSTPLQMSLGDTSAPFLVNPVPLKRPQVIAQPLRIQPSVTGQDGNRFAPKGSNYGNPYGSSCSANPRDSILQSRQRSTDSMCLKPKVTGAWI
jgi:hypothetical protein